MRFLYLVLILIVVSCGNSTTVLNEKAIIGSWKLMGMLKSPFPIEKITETDLMGGFIEFKEDGTFEGEVTFPKFPDKKTKASGTYQIQNGVITISNQLNNSSTKSTIRFERDFMIMTPLDPEGFTAYYKRNT